jgi:hypothetical protein
VDLPAGPDRAVPWEPASEGDAVLVLRLVNLAWSAARLRDASVGHGAVAVARRVVRGAAPAARAAGVVAGMSVAAARRRCPRLRLVRPVEARTLRQAVIDWLGGAVGAARVEGAAIVVPWSVGQDEAGALSRAERLLRRLWQAFGVEVRGVIARESKAGRVVAGLLGPREVALVPDEAQRAWAGRPTRRVAVGEAGGDWCGPSVPDVEGVVVLARALASGAAPRGATLRVRSVSGVTDLPIPRPSRAVGLAASIEPRLRIALARADAVEGLRLRTTRGARAADVRPRDVRRAVTPQLALLPGAR